MTIVNKMRWLAVMNFAVVTLIVIVLRVVLTELAK